MVAHAAAIRVFDVASKDVDGWGKPGHDDGGDEKSVFLPSDMSADCHRLPGPDRDVQIILTLSHHSRGAAIVPSLEEGQCLALWSNSDGGSVASGSVF
jgi:hypothetical protein